MSILGQKVSINVSTKVIAATAGLMLLAALLPALSSTPTREVTLIAKGMAFYLESDLSTPNPTLEVKAGERLRVVLRNQDRGLTHDFAVPAVAAAMNVIDWNESGEVVFDVPDTPGTYEYMCRPHALMMRGTIRVY
jgi:plastocyanin